MKWYENTALKKRQEKVGNPEQQPGAVAHASRRSRNGRVAPTHLTGLGEPNLKNNMKYIYMNTFIYMGSLSFSMSQLHPSNLEKTHPVRYAENDTIHAVMEILLISTMLFNSVQANQSVTSFVLRNTLAKEIILIVLLPRTKQPPDLSNDVLRSLSWRIVS